MSFEDHDPPVHLLRGAPTVRSWSKYKQTVPGWTLCGILRGVQKNNAGWRNAAVEEPRTVTCKYCRELIGPRQGAA